MSQKEQATQNLLDFAALLDSLGIIYWLDGGTILGAYRDGDFCADDHDDIDIFCWAKGNIELKQSIIQRANAIGFQVVGHWEGDARTPGLGQEVAFSRDNLKIDLNFFERSGDTAWGCAYVRNVCIPQVCPAAFYDNLVPIEFKGRTFNAPGPIEAYLEHRYGDWRTPIHREQYSYTNPEQLKALHPDFPFWDHAKASWANRK